MIVRRIHDMEEWLKELSNDISNEGAQKSHESAPWGEKVHSDRDANGVQKQPFCTYLPLW